MPCKLSVPRVKQDGFTEITHEINEHEQFQRMIDLKPIIFTRTFPKGFLKFSRPITSNPNPPLFGDTSTHRLRDKLTLNV